MLFAIVGQVWAADVEQAELMRLQERIHEITARLNQVRTQHDAALEQFRSHEIETGSLVKQLHDIQERLTRNSVDRQKLKAQTATERNLLDEQRSLLVHHMRVTYSLGRQNAIKLLLNLEDFGSLNRGLNYHVFLQSKRLARITAVTESLTKITAIEAKTTENRVRLLALRDEKTTAAEALRDHREARTALIASLQSELASGSEELGRLRRNEEELAQLLAGLRQELTDIALPAEEIESFASLRGALPWPTSGALLNRFGTSRPQGDLKWQGVLISAAEGVAVNAISHGRVAFADWLRGFGLLLIVDHGNGYMSLYGRNQSLFKEVGEWVSTGEQIAVVGEANASGPAALYFEIRHNGAPQNPTRWCDDNTLVSG